MGLILNPRCLWLIVIEGEILAFLDNALTHNVLIEWLPYIIDWLPRASKVILHLNDCGLDIIVSIHIFTDISAKTNIEFVMTSFIVALYCKLRSSNCISDTQLKKLHSIQWNFFIDEIKFSMESWRTSQCEITGSIPI